ncbi:MAG: hypothetical protein K9H12_12125 [Bacteroidales bacterium]|nr:hypothetical protein [Bacteroidales bacterium]
MNKSKEYKYTFFSVEVIQKAIKKLEEITKVDKIDPISLRITLQDEAWQHDNLSEFYSDYIKEPKWVHLNFVHKSNGFGITYTSYKKLLN